MPVTSQLRNELDRSFIFRMPRWTIESKLAQRDRIKQQRPWLCSTGPVTTHGKRMSSHNARGAHRRRCPAAVEPEPREIREGDSVRFIGTDAFVRGLVGDEELVVLRVKPDAIVCNIKNAAVFIEARDKNDLERV